MTHAQHDVWDSVDEAFITARTRIGVEVVTGWARAHIAPGATILDVGCGHGVPVAQALVADGFRVAGVDASPKLIAAFRRNVPGMEAVCEPVQDSALFGRSFPGIIAIGLIFLLSAEDQARLLARLPDALEPGGRLLFTAPRQRCRWRDLLTGQPSVSLGADAYARALAISGGELIGEHRDEGGNHYFDCVRPA